MVPVKEFYAQPKNYIVQEKKGNRWVTQKNTLNGSTCMRKGEAQIFLNINKKVYFGTNGYKILRKKKHNKC